MRVARFAPVLALVFLSFMQLPALAGVKVEDSVTVNAEPEFVWNALMKYQKEEKTFNKKRVSVHNNSNSFKEQFISLPIVGATSLDYIEVNHPQENRIDFKLTDSKVLTKFEGSWQVEQAKDGNGVTLKLTTAIDTWMFAPFKNKILRNITKKGMEKRLAFVKDYAENSSKVSSSGATK